MKESTINPKAAEYVNLKGVNAYGEPVFRKHIKDRSILVKRTRMERVLFTPYGSSGTTPTRLLRST